MAVAGEASLEAACLKLGILSEASTVQLQEDLAWRRAGSETYQLECVVKSSQARDARILFKACVAYEPNSSAGEIARAWLARRDALARLGTGTPRLYGMINATIIEEWVELTFFEAFKRAAPRVRQSMAHQLGVFSGALSALGFWPTAAFHDLRSRGEDLVVVDFGEDIGPPGISKTPLGLTLAYDAISTVENYGVQLVSENVRAVVEGFESVRGSTSESS